MWNSYEWPKKFYPSRIFMREMDKKKFLNKNSLNLGWVLKSRETAKTCSRRAWWADNDILFLFKKYFFLCSIRSQNTNYWRQDLLWMKILQQLEDSQLVNIKLSSKVRLDRKIAHMTFHGCHVTWDCPMCSPNLGKLFIVTKFQLNFKIGKRWIALFLFTEFTIVNIQVGNYL